MELDWLETLLAVVNEGGFTAAAERIHRSQSRVSAHIAGLEREFGTQLIDRHHRPATLTAAGEVVVAHARAVLAEVEAARASVAVLRAARGHAVAILTTPELETPVLTLLVPSLTARFPDAQVTVRTTTTPPTALAATSDGFAVAVLPAVDPPLPLALRERLLWRDKLQLVVPADHELAGQSPVTRTELKRNRLLIGAAAEGAHVPALGEICAAAVAVTNVGSASTVVELVRRGMGVGVETATALRGADIAGVEVLDIDDDDLMVDVAAYWFDPLLRTPFGQAVYDALAGLSASHRSAGGAWPPA